MAAPLCGQGFSSQIVSGPSFLESNWSGVSAISSLVLCRAHRSWPSAVSGLLASMLAHSL